VKLKDWADKVGIKYLTAYRWFKNNTLPVRAYQTNTGTILVEDEDVDMGTNVDINDKNIISNSMSLFLKKTVEYSKNNSSVEDFAAYLLSNFQFVFNDLLDIKINNNKYSKQKPSSEEILKQFQGSLVHYKEREEELRQVKKAIKNDPNYQKTFSKFEKKLQQSEIEKSKFNSIDNTFNDVDQIKTSVLLEVEDNLVDNVINYPKDNAILSEKKPKTRKNK